MLENPHYSTEFLGKKAAIVHKDSGGITRDILHHRITWNGKNFLIVDTGGIQLDPTIKLAEDVKTIKRVVFCENSLKNAVLRSVKSAIESGDVLIMITDGFEGPTSLDTLIMNWLRQKHSHKNIILAVNKCDDASRADLMASSFCELGIDPIPISAINGFSCFDLLQKATDLLPVGELHESKYMRASEDSLTVVLIGRPNVGKSSLVNTILGKEKSIISELGGTTRDSVRSEFIRVDGRIFTLVDTAGIRKRASVDSSVGSAEVMSVYQAFTAIKQADVVILVLDVNDGPTIQDYRISEKVLKEGRACVVAINKWDSIPHKSITLQAEMFSNATTQLRPTKWANIVFTSSKSGQGVKILMQAVVKANTEHKRRITTASLNHILSEIKIFLSSDSVRAIRTKAKIYFGVQVSTRPPTFIIFVNDPKLFRGILQKLIEKKIRENVGFKGTPIRLIWRGKTTKKIEK
jgi:GTP-binding protein